jgi:quercetin dioxygenase-like cupin family protein
METTQQKVFVEDDSIPWEEAGPGMKRKIMGFGASLMMVKVAFEKGSVGAVHSHYHTQVTHIASGVFEVDINGTKKKLSAGDGFFVPPNVMHGVVCIESGMLIDAFSPMREDFLAAQ